jgi:hypothetical protein
MTCHPESLNRLFDAMKKIYVKGWPPNSSQKNVKHRIVLSYERSVLGPTLTGPITLTENHDVSFETTELRQPSSSDVLHPESFSVSTPSRNSMDLGMVSPGLELPSSDSIKQLCMEFSLAEPTGVTTPPQVDVDMDMPTELGSLDTSLVNHHEDKPHGMPLPSNNHHLC